MIQKNFNEMYENSVCDGAVYTDHISLNRAEYHINCIVGNILKDIQKRLKILQKSSNIKRKELLKLIEEIERERDKIIK